MAESPPLTKAQINATKLIKIQPPDRDDELCPEYFSCHSEQIAKFIIEKFISFAVTESFVKNLSLKIPDECFDFAKSTLNTYINSQYIAYDRDEYKTVSPLDKVEDLPEFNVDNNDSHIAPDITNTNQIPNGSSLNVNSINAFDLSNQFFNNYYRGENMWDIIEEPCSNEIDRYASSMILYTKKVPEISSPTISQDSNKHLDKIEEEDHKAPPSMTTTQKKLVKEFSTSSKLVANPNSNNYNSSSVEVVPKKKKNNLEVMNELSFHDIQMEENPEQIKYDLEVAELRKEKENEVLKIETEKKKMVMIEKEVQIKIKEEQNKYKEFEKKKVTVDANGQIVLIKSIRPEQLAKDFIMIRTGSKNVNNFKYKKKRKIIKIKKENIERNASISEQPEAVSNVTTGNEKIEKGGRNQLPKIESAKKNPKGTIAPVQSNKKTIDLQNINPSTILLEKKKERGPIIPSGSCFDLISMEVGVNLIEDKKYKTGGKDFFHKFNKYSFETYNKQLKNTITTNMSLVSNQAILTSSNMITNTDYNYHENLTDSNVFNNMTSYNRKINVNPLLKTQNMKTINTLNQTSYNPLIKMSSKQFSLRSAMDNLDLIAERVERSQGKLNRKDIFKEKISITDTNERRDPQVVTHDKKELDEMNKFAMTLINDNWGGGFQRGKGKINLGRIPFKPQLKQIEREIGKDALTKIKQLPRVRGNMINKLSLSTDNFGLKQKKH